MDVLFNSFNERLAAWRSKSSASDATQAAQAVTGAAALTAWDIFNYLNTTAQAVVGATYLTAVDITNRVGVTSGVKAATELLYAGVAKAQEVADPDTATKVRWCEGQPCGYMLRFVFMLLAWRDRNLHGASGSFRQWLCRATGAVGCRRANSDCGAPPQPTPVIAWSLLSYALQPPAPCSQLANARRGMSYTCPALPACP